MKKLLLVGMILVAAWQANAQILAPVQWSYAAKKTSPTEAVVLLKATIDRGWHVYSQHVKEGGPVKTSFTFTPAATYAVSGPTQEPKPVQHYEKAFDMQVSYFENSVVFQQKIKLKGKGPVTVKGNLEYMVCNDKQCLPPDQVTFSIPVN